MSHPDTMAPPREARRYPRGTRVAAMYQQMTGAASPGAAHQRELAVKRKARQLMQAYRLSGSVEAGHRWLLELAAALRPDAPALTPELICRAEEADAAENECQTAFLTDPNKDTLRRWRIAVETVHGMDADLIVALRAEEDR